MSGRPDPVCLDDLAAPRFTDDVSDVLALTEEAGVTLALEPEALRAAARSETGLDEFGPDDFSGRLGLLCRAMREEGGFNGAGVMQQHALITGLLKNSHRYATADSGLRRKIVTPRPTNPTAPTTIMARA